MSLHNEIRIVLSESPLTFNQDVKAVVANDGVDPTFLYYALVAQKDRLLGLVSSSGHGTGVLDTDRLKALPIPLIAPEEQAALANAFKVLDDKIELNRVMNDTLEAMASAIFRDWFVSFGPVRRKQAGATDPVEIMGGLTIDRLQAANLEKLFPPGFGSDGLPVEFEWSNLGEATSVLESGKRPAGGIKGIESGVPSIGAESIVGLAKFDFSKTRFVPHEFYSSMRRGVVGDRDVLVYKDGGRPGVFEPHIAMFGSGFPFEECCINEHVYRLVSREPFTQEYLYLHLTSEASLEEMRRRGTGVAIPGLNSAAAASLSILSPGEPLLKAFTDLTRPLIDAALHNALTSRALAETRDYLLHRLMSGAFQVRAEGVLSA